MFICIERKNGERSIVSLSACKIKLNKRKDMATLEGPEKTSLYFSGSETMFLVKTEIEAVRFLTREELSIDSIYMPIIGSPNKLYNIDESKEEPKE